MLSNSSSYRTWKYGRVSDYYKVLFDLNMEMIGLLTTRFFTYVAAFAFVPAVLVVYHYVQYDSASKFSVVEIFPVQSHNVHAWLAFVVCVASLFLLYLFQFVHLGYFIAVLWIAYPCSTMNILYLKVALGTLLWTMIVATRLVLRGWFYTEKAKDDLKTKQDVLVSCMRMTEIYEISRFPAEIVELIEGYEREIES
jgi:hypothetical protein